MKLIDEIHVAYPAFDSRQMTPWLRRQKEPINRIRLRRLIRRMELVAIYRQPNPSRRHPQLVVFPACVPHKGQPHLHRDKLDACSLLFRKGRQRPLRRRLGPVLDDLELAAVVQVGLHCPVMVPKAETLYIEPAPRYRLCDSPRQSPPNRSIPNRVRLVPVQFQMLRRFRLARGQQQQIHQLNLELRGEMRTSLRPRRQHLLHPMGREFDAGHAITKTGRAVDRVRMPPPSLRGMVVERARPPALGAMALSS
jgi:hypothetical protein